jgi:ribose transport system substrate-binding protein
MRDSDRGKYRYLARASQGALNKPDWQQAGPVRCISITKTTNNGDDTMKNFKNVTFMLAGGLTAVSMTLAADVQAKDLKDISIAVIPKVAVPFFDDCNNGAKTASEKLGVKYQWVVPQNTQGSTQVKIIEDLISKHVDGIAISVNEPKSVESVIKRAIKSGIKVLTYDSDSPKSGRSMYIGTNNESAGATMADTMAKSLAGKGEVAIITGQLGAVNLNERIAGIRKGLSKYPDIKIVETQGTEDDLAKGVSVVETTLRAHPQLKGIFGVSQVGGPAVAKVLNTKEFGKLKGTLEVLAFDDLPDTVKGVRDGFIQGIMVQRPVTMGKLAVEHLVAQIQGEERQSKDVDTGVTVVTKENLTGYTK